MALIEATRRAAAAATAPESDRPIAPPLGEVSPAAEVALLARMLFREGYDDHLAGHITYRQDDDTLLVNPFGMTWDEVRASDVMRIDMDGKVLDGPWTVTPAITLHLELHRARDDVRFAVHNHPRWSTLYAAAQRIPGVYDQTSAFVAGDPALFDDYSGAVDDPTNASRAVEALGSSPIALLANHGVLVVAKDVQEALFRAITIEWRCRTAWHVEAMGGGIPMRPEIHEHYAGLFAGISFPGLFEAMARREVRNDPSVVNDVIRHRHGFSARYLLDEGRRRLSIRTGTATCPGGQGTS